ncbi:hypothetical protein GC194_12025 [bacterium]|nr:hypothetical protein [bacterium]
MKRFLSIIALLGCSASILQAQEPTRPTFEKRVYVNGDNTYVHKDLPIYLYFSTSNDPNATKYLLKSKTTGDYANPMFFDTEGVNYIRHRWAVEQNTGKTVEPKIEVLFEVYADGLAPVTTSAFAGAPTYYNGGTVYYGKGLSITLNSRDAVSGLEAMHYSLNGGNYTNYTSPLTNFKEGTNNIYYFGSDNVGNAENTRTKSFIFDITAPVTNSVINGIKYGDNILSPTTTLSLPSSDNLSGLNRTLYNFDNGTDRRYYGNINIGSLADGQHTIYYYSYDNVKNEEVKKSLSFYLDKIPPVTTYSIDGDLCEKGSIKWVSTRSVVKLSATDNKAGVFKIYYRIGRSLETVHGETRVDYGAPISIPATYGAHVLKYDAMDNVENLSHNAYLTVYMDNLAPETGITYGRPQFFTRDTLFINSTTKIVLNATDRGSGVVKTEYAVDGGGMNAYSGNFTLANHGHRTITFKSTDCVNNVEELKTSKVFVDNKPPKIHHNFSIEPIGTKGDLKIYPNYTRLYLGATDRHVGTERILYSINGSAFTDYSSPQTLDISELNRFSQKQKYTVKVKAYDKLGNVAEETIEFYVGRDED